MIATKPKKTEVLPWFCYPSAPQPSIHLEDVYVVLNNVDNFKYLFFGCLRMVPLTER